MSLLSGVCERDVDADDRLALGASRSELHCLQQLVVSLYRDREIRPAVVAFLLDAFGRWQALHAAWMAV